MNFYLLQCLRNSALWLQVFMTIKHLSIYLPLREMGFNLNKREFRDAIKLRYDWQIDDGPSMSVWREVFTVDHAMVFKRGGFVIQRHNELRDLEAELLRTLCNDVEIEPVLQDISEERLNRGANKAPVARLVFMQPRGFWEPQRSAFFDVRVCHPNAESYKDVPILKQSSRHRTRNIHAPSIYDNRRNGPRMFEVPQSPCRTDSIKVAPTCFAFSWVTELYKRLSYASWWISASCC